MEWYWALALLVGTALGLMSIGVPVALAFLGANIVGAIIFFGGELGLAQAVRNAVEGLANFTLAPVVMFILMGEVLFRSGVAVRAIDTVERLMLDIPGRLALVTVGGGAVFATLTGSSMASTAVLASTVLPEMRRRGYHPGMSMGPIMGTGGIAMLIPPSGMAVLLGSLSGISISGILVTAAIPGLLIALCYTLYILARCGLNPKLAPRYETQSIATGKKLKLFFVHIAPLFSLCLLVIGSILFGWATPTESAAVGAMGAVVLCACYRCLTWAVLRDALVGTGKVAVPILFIAAMSLTFSQILSFSGATQGIVQLVQTLNPGSFALLVLMLSVVLLLGCLMDPYSILLITLPFYMPLAKLAGFDLIWFGVLLLLGLEIGQVTPPFGMILFVMKGIATESKMKEIYLAVAPFILMELSVLIFLMLVPGTVTWLSALTH
jgi:tripartite ATP-independent transporter DctM subunit